MDRNIIAVIGGTGLYDIEGLEQIEKLEISTPFGSPSAPIIRGQLAGAELLFLPRHGLRHNLLPSEINYRANIFALKSLGAKWCVSVSAVGSLKEELSPGMIAIPDQLIDRTSGRCGTFFGNEIVAHVSLADPYCPVLRQAIYLVAKKEGERGNFKVHSGGTYVCMEGPAFSTRAESNLHRSWGASYIGMTNCPEAKLAREAEIAYATLALVTDYDCWKASEEAVDTVSVLKILHSNAAHAKNIIAALPRALQNLQPSEIAANALKNALVTQLKGVGSEKLAAMKPILGKYSEL